VDIPCTTIKKTLMLPAIWLRKRMLVSEKNTCKPANDFLHIIDY
jgi:hypothetical protein